MIFLPDLCHDSHPFGYMIQGYKYNGAFSVYLSDLVPLDTDPHGECDPNPGSSVADPDP